MVKSTCPSTTTPSSCSGSGASCAVPGSVAGLGEARVYGRMPWRAPRARGRGRGRASSSSRSRHSSTRFSTVPSGPRTRSANLRTGAPCARRDARDERPRRHPRVARSGRPARLRGIAGPRLSAAVCEGGGRITEQDLRVPVIRRRPVRASSGSHEFVSNRPPSSGGLLIAFALRARPVGHARASRECCGAAALTEVMREATLARGGGFLRSLYRGGLANRLLDERSVDAAARGAHTGTRQTAREPAGVIIGAGFSGMYMLHSLRDKLDLNVTVIEAGGGVGGTWYWNRYPGPAATPTATSTLHVRQEPVAGMEVVRALSGAGRDPALPRALCRALRPEAGHRVRHARRRGGLRRRHRALDGAHRLGRDVIGRASSSRPSARCRPPTSADQGAGLLPGKSYHTASGRTKASTSPASGWRHRHRGHRGAGDPRDRAAGQRPHGVPAHAELLRARAQRPGRSRGRQGAQGRLRRIRERIQELALRLRAILHTEGGARDHAEEREHEFDKMWDAGGFAFWLAHYRTCSSPRRPTMSSRRLSQAQDPRERQRPGDRREADARRYSYGTKRQPLDTNYFETFNKKNVQLVDASTDVRSRRSRRMGSRRRQGVSLDIIVIATGFDAMTGPLKNIDIKGRGGRTLLQEWEDGPQTPTSGWRVPATPTCSRSPARRARRCCRTCRSRSSSMSSGSPNASPTCAKNKLKTIEASPRGAGRMGRPRRRGRRFHPDARHQFLVHGRQHRRQAASLLALPRPGGRRRLPQKCAEVAEKGYEGFVFTSWGQGGTVHTLRPNNSTSLDRGLRSSPGSRHGASGALRGLCVKLASGAGGGASSLKRIPCRDPDLCRVEVSA